MTGAATGRRPDRRGPASPAVPVYWPDAGQRLGTDVYDGGRLADGDAITGPALVELPHTTIAVPRAASLTADRGHFRLLLPAARDEPRRAAETMTDDRLGRRAARLHPGRATRHRPDA